MKKQFWTCVQLAAGVGLVLFGLIGAPKVASHRIMERK